MTSAVVDSGGITVTAGTSSFQSITFTTGNGTGTITAPTFVGALTGNASSANILATPRTINGVAFDGSANITVTAAAGTLTGATLNATVTASSLTSVGVLAAPHMTSPVVDSGGITVTAGTSSFQSITATTVLASSTVEVTTAGAIALIARRTENAAVAIIRGYYNTTTIGFELGVDGGGNAVFKGLTGNSSITINKTTDAVTLLNALTVGGSIVPGTDSVFDLGSGGVQWRNLWLWGTLSVHGTALFHSAVTLESGLTIAGSLAVNATGTVFSAGTDASTSVAIGGVAARPQEIAP
jgi:hypothetical protein